MEEPQRRGCLAPGLFKSYVQLSRVWHLRERLAENLQWPVGAKSMPLRPLLSHLQHCLGSHRKPPEATGSSPKGPTLGAFVQMRLLSKRYQ